MTPLQEAIALLTECQINVDNSGLLKRITLFLDNSEKEESMTPLERYSAFCKAQAISIDAQIAAGCKVLIIESSGHQIYLEAMAYLEELAKERP